MLGVAVAIFGVNAVNNALKKAGQQAEKQTRMQEELQREADALPPIIPIPDDEKGSEDGTVGEGESATSQAIIKRWNLPDIPVSERGNRKVESFRTAKNIIYDTHKDLKMETTFYCGCTYKKRKPVFSSCGYKVRKRKTRAGRTEIEHVMPASRFGHTFSEWTEGHPSCERKGREYKGRSCAEDASPEFVLMESDLFNLQPSVGEVNGDRLDYEWGELKGEAREYGDCDMEIRDQLAEPPSSVRGDIARVYLYMAWAYPGRIELSEKELAMYTAWDKSDPVSKDELRRAEELSREQGNIQPLIIGR